MSPEDVRILKESEFREVWEALPRPSKRVIRRAVSRGVAVDDPHVAAAVVSLARQYQQVPILGLVFYTAGFVFWVVMLGRLIDQPGSGTVSYYRVIALLWVVGIPAKIGLWLFVQRPRYRRAELLNLGRLGNYLAELGKAGK